MNTRYEMLFLTLILFLFPLNLRAAPQAPPKTRASQLGTLATGMGALINMDQFLQEYPGSRTAILYYLKMDGAEASALASTLRLHAAIQEKRRREFWPQIALETSTLSLAAFRRELSTPGSPLDTNIRTLARAIAAYRDKNKWFFIRPFSEMNDGTDENPWEFGAKSYSNSPQDLANAWKLLRDTFDQEGATNAIFIFSPLAAYHVHRESQVLAALNLIPPGYIDAFGVNVYSRPLTAYGGSSPIPPSFATLAEPWMQVLARSRHRGIPLAVPEMGISSQASDTQRAAWLHAAFNFARTHGFVMVTYFNYPHPYWEIDDQTLAGATLRAELGGVRIPRIAAATGLPEPGHDNRLSGPEAEIARNWQLLAGSDTPTVVQANTTTWRALALVYPQREVASGSDRNTPPILLEMPREQVVAAVQALRNWPAYIARATDGAVNIDLTIAMSRRPLRLAATDQGTTLQLAHNDLDAALLPFRKTAHFDSIETVWYVGAGAAVGGTAGSLNGTAGTWADVALSGTMDRDALSSLAEHSNVFVIRWLQGVIAYIRSLGYACPAFEDAARYGYGKEPERWAHDLAQGALRTEGRQEGLSSTLWRAGTPSHPRAVLPVQLLAPPNNSVWDPLPELTWAATSAEKYRVEIRNPQDVDHPIHTAETTTAHYTVPAGILQLGQLYTWRVVALRGKEAADDGDRFNVVLDHIPPPEFTQESVKGSSLPWIGGTVPVTVQATSRTVIKEVRVVIEMPDGTRRQSLLQPAQNAQPALHWEGVCPVPANRSDRWIEAHIHFEATDLTGQIASTAPRPLRVAPRNPQLGPRLELAEANPDSSPLHGVVRIHALRDRYLRASGIVYLLQVDDQVLATERRTPFEFAWNSSDVPDGEHRLRLLLRDTVTNDSVVSDEIILNVRNQPGASP